MVFWSTRIQDEANQVRFEGGGGVKQRKARSKVIWSGRMCETWVLQLFPPVTKQPTNATLQLDV